MYYAVMFCINSDIFLEPIYPEDKAPENYVVFNTSSMSITGTWKRGGDLKYSASDTCIGLGITNNAVQPPGEYALGRYGGLVTVNSDVTAVTGIFDT